MIPPGFLLYTQFAGLSLFSKEKTSNNLKFINFLEKLVQKYDKIFSDIPVILSVGRRRENDGRTEMAERNRGMENFVQLKNVSKVYKMGEVEIRAVDGIEFSISKGEFVVIVGPSGAGKTTVLNILGGMDTATKGQVLVDGDERTGRVMGVYVSDDHTPAMLPVFAYGPGADKFCGTYMNTEIARRIKSLIK